jgi:hypothetical protein
MCLALDLPKRGPWIGNGRTLAKFVDTIHRKPQLVDRRIDADKIILVGHSFGAHREMSRRSIIWVLPMRKGKACRRIIRKP